MAMPWHKRAFDISNARVNGTVRPDENVMVKYDANSGQMVASSAEVVQSQTSRNETGDYWDQASEHAPTDQNLEGQGGYGPRLRLYGG